MKRKVFSLMMALVLAVSVFAAMTVSVSAGSANETTANLDLTNNTKSVDQKYNLTVTNTYTDVSKVKLTWELDTIDVTRQDAKKWNPDTLSWDDDNDNDVFTLGADSTAAKFTLTNYSSEKVKANVVFKVADDLSSTFDKITYVNNDCVIGSKVQADKSVDDNADIDEEITTALYVDKTKFTSDAVTDGTYGTYTVTIMGADVNNVVSTTINSASDTTLSVGETLSEDTTKETTVEIPAETVGFEAGKVASLDVEATAVLEAVSNPTFNISSNESAVSAIDLNVKVNGTEIHEFKDKAGDPVEVTVTTYIAKGFTNLSMKYVGTGDDPTVESYDPETGKLVFKTTHFSTFAIGAKENAYVEETNTAYLLQDALNALDAEQNIVLLKDITDSSILRANKGVGTYTIDLNSHEISFAETTEKDEMAVVLEGDGTFTLKNGTFTCADYHYGDIFDIWAETTFDHVTVNFTDEAETGFARWGALYIGAKTTMNDCTINAVKGPGIQNGEKNNVLTLNNSTITSGDHSAIYCGGGSTTYVNNCTVSGLKAIHGCTSGAAFIINGGTYTGSEKAIQLDNTTTAVDYQGIPNYVGGSYASVKAGTFNGVLKLNPQNEGIVKLEISGGTFTVDPNAYLATGYEATQNAGVWTVTETVAD